MLLVRAGVKAHQSLALIVYHVLQRGLVHQLRKRALMTVTSSGLEAGGLHLWYFS
jgi:hypothetical protein